MCDLLPLLPSLQDACLEWWSPSAAGFQRGVQGGGGRDSNPIVRVGAGLAFFHGAKTLISFVWWAVLDSNQRLPA